MVEQEKLAQEFVSLLVAEDFSGAVEKFDAAMMEMMPEPVLSNTWAQVLEQAGAFGEQVATQSGDHEGLRIVVVTCAFANVKLDVRVVYTKALEVTGLGFENPAPLDG